MEHSTLSGPLRTLASSSLTPSLVHRTDASARSGKVAWPCRPRAGGYSSLVRPLLCPARSPEKGRTALANATVLPRIQQLLPANSSQFPL